MACDDIRSACKYPASSLPQQSCTCTAASLLLKSEQSKVPVVMGLQRVSVGGRLGEAPGGSPWTSWVALAWHEKSRTPGALMEPLGTGSEVGTLQRGHNTVTQTILGNFGIRWRIQSGGDTHSQAASSEP